VYQEEKTPINPSENPYKNSDSGLSPKYDENEANFKIFVSPTFKRNGVCWGWHKEIKVKNNRKLINK
jgi:hypothetical protein